MMRVDLPLVKNIFHSQQIPLNLLDWIMLKGFNNHQHGFYILKSIYSEKATTFCEIFTLLLSYVVPDKSKVKILQNFVAFSEYMNFTYIHLL